MSHHKNEIFVGFVVIVAIVVAIFGYLFIQEIPVKKQGYVITILFDNVSGLTRSDPVTVSGMKIGRVREMSLVKNHVAVSVWLDGKIPYPRDSRAGIKSMGMIGEKFIDLQPGVSSERLKDGDTILGTYVTDLADAGGSINELVSQATSLLMKFNETIDQKSLQQAHQNAITSIENMREISDAVNKDIADNMLLLKQTLVNFDSISSSVNKFWAHERQNAELVMNNVAASTQNLPVVVARLDSALVATQTLLAKIDQQENTVGKLLADDELYVKANETIGQMQVLLTDIKEHPGRYFQMEPSLINLF